MRQVLGLTAVEFLARRPDCIPRARNLRSAQRQGLAYEKKFGRWLALQGLSPRSGQWLRFYDAQGSGLAQPDHFLILPRGVVLFECKLSESPEAWPQLAFYSVLLSRALSLPVLEVQVCKNLRTTQEPVRDISSLRPGCVLHWLP